MAQLTPLSPEFAARIDGIQAASASQADIAFVRAALIDHCVLVLPGQQLADDEQARFAASFGELDSYSQMSGDYARGMRKDLLQVSNLGDDGRPVGFDDRRRLLDMGNRFWHTDASFKPVPAHLSMLYGIEVTRQGGETQFADMRAAWDNLEADRRDLVEGLSAEHSATTARRALGFDDFREDNPAVTSRVTHDLVRMLPETGRKTLYLSAHADHIVGMPVPAGRLLLAELTEHATRPGNVFTHRWQTRDLVIWDNRCTMHRACRYRADRETRQLRRASTIAPEFAANSAADVRVPAWKIEAAA
jgi:alpha-ketoglutarate-dependent 2,4-dichlorophenoxyacetate dioxygenase